MRALSPLSKSSFAAALFWAWPLVGLAQVLAPDVARLSQELESVQNDFSAGRKQLAQVLAYQTSVQSYAGGFFEVTNIALWLLWGSLLVFLLLLVAVRRNLLSAVRVVQAALPTAADKVGSEARLVQPIQFVKIKVRKIKKN